MQQELNLIKTGFTKIDELIGDFSTGEVMLISGPNIYEEEQSEFLFFLVRLITLGSGVPGALYTRFYLPSHIYNRLIDSVTGIPWMEISLGEVDKTEIELVNIVSNQISDLPLVINLMPDMQDLFEEARKHYKYKGIKIIYLNGAKHFKTDSRFSNYFEKQKHIIQVLKQFAKELNIAIVITFFCRETEWTCKSCKEIENTADIILELDNLQSSNVPGVHHQKMRVLKTQNGKTGTYDLLFMPTTPNYEFF